MTQEFHISVTPLRGDEYLVRVEHVEPGVPLAEEQLVWSVKDWLHQARQLMNDPLLGVLQGDRVDRVSSYPRRDRRGVGSQARQPSLVELGRELYAAVFQGTLRDSWMTAQGIAQHRGEVLRLRLGVKGSQLPKLPWEVMQGDGRWSGNNPSSRPIATGTDVVFSRYQPHTRTLRTGLLTAVEPDKTVRVLMAIAAPTDQQQLELKREATHLQQELQHHSKTLTRGMIGILPDIELTILEQPGREDLAQALEQGDYHVLHYAGHSNLSEGGGILHLVNRDTGLTETLNGVDLAGLLANNGIRMAIFNSCRGSYTATIDSRGSEEGQSLTEALVNRGIPAVLAMAEQIPDAVALTLTRLFYRNLKQGYPVDLSLSRARQGLLSAYGSNQLYWALPVLYLHPEFDGYLTGGDRTLDNPADSLVRIPQLYSSPLPLAPYEAEPSETSDAAIPHTRYLEPTAGTLPDGLLPVEDDVDEAQLRDDDKLTFHRFDSLDRDQHGDEWPHRVNIQADAMGTASEALDSAALETDWFDNSVESSEEAAESPVGDRSIQSSRSQADRNLPDGDRLTYTDSAADVSDLVRELSESSRHESSHPPSVSRNGNRLSVDDDLFLDLSSTNREVDPDDWPDDFPALQPASSTTSLSPTQAADITMPFDDAESEEFDVEFLSADRQGVSSQTGLIQGRSPQFQSQDDLYAIVERPSRRPWLIWLPLAGLGAAALVAAGYWAISNRSIFIPPESSPQQPRADEQAAPDVNQLTRQAITHFNQGELDAGGQAVATLLDQEALIQSRAALNAVPLDDIDDPWMSFLRGRLTWQSVQRGDLDFSVEDARRYWQVASRGEPDSAVYATALGFALYEESKFADAIESFERSLSVLEAQDPAAPSLQQVEQALEAPEASAAIISLPNNSDALTAYAGLALAWVQSGDDLDANLRDEDALRRAVRLYGAIVAADPAAYDTEALAQNWLWTTAAIEAWEQLGLIEGFRPE